MDLLDRLLGHDAWTTRQLLLQSRTLTDAQLDQPFDLGLGTLRLTFGHIIDNMEVWTNLMNGVDVSLRSEGPQALEDFLGRLDAVAASFSTLARKVATEGRLDERWTDTLDDPPTQKTYGGAIAHVITHSMHHWAQVIHMLKRLGVQGVIEGDVLSWENQLRAGS